MKPYGEELDFRRGVERLRLVKTGGRGLWRSRSGYVAIATTNAERARVRRGPKKRARREAQREIDRGES